MNEKACWQLPQDKESVYRHIFAGGVFAYPTEAVYGLGGNPADERAVCEILRLKGRTAAKGLIMVAGNWAQCCGWVSGVSKRDQAEMMDWAGDYPTTFIVSAGEKLCAHVATADGKTAIRISQHPLIQELCALIGQPLLSTSANLSGQEPARSVAAVRQYFPDLPMVLGALGAAERPSRIIDWHSRQVIRA